MDVQAIRLQRLQALLKEHGHKQVALAQAIGKQGPQLNQWLSGYRAISERSARAIEHKLRKPHGWMDTLGTAADDAYPPPPPPTLHQALEVLGTYLAQPLQPEVLEDVALHLSLLAKRQGSARDQAFVEQLLTPGAAQSKPPRTGTQ